jgi:hypothetical protein
MGYFIELDREEREEFKAPYFVPPEIEVFLCYLHANRKIAGDIKSTLESFNFSCFLAHEDIKPTSRWLM